MIQEGRREEGKRQGRNLGKGWKREEGKEEASKEEKGGREKGEGGERLREGRKEK